MRPPDQIEIEGIEFLEEFDRGVRGLVYRVRKDQRVYALKFAQSGSKSAARMEWERLAGEAASLACVAHPALPNVLEVGGAGARPYILMESVEGESLADRLAGTKLSEAEVVRIGIRLANVLGHIHAIGLVHGDLDPQNVVLDAKTSAARLLDFGFSCAGDRASGLQWNGSSGLDAAPETSERTIDGRGDLFALGSLLAKCVLGRQALSSSVCELLNEAAKKGAVSSGLVAVISRLLGAAGLDPYETGWEVARDLRELAQFAVESDEDRRIGLACADEFDRPPQLVGRDNELARLRMLLAETLGGRGGIAVIEGEAGLGKTGLGWVFSCEAAVGGAQVLKARCEQWNPRPFATVRQLVDGFLEAANRLPAEECQRRIETLRAAAEGFGSVLGAVSPLARQALLEPPMIGAPEDLQPVFVDGLAAFLARWTASLGPTVVWIDDVQWVDGSSRKVLTRAAARTGSSPVLYLLASRPDDEDNSGSLERLRRALPGSLQETIELRPLHGSEAEALVAVHLGNPAIDPKLFEYIERFSDKTPLSIIELLRAILQAGLLVPHWGSWKFHHDRIDTMLLPSGAAEIMEKRLEGLGGELSDLLSTAAVVGAVFEDDLLAGVCGLDPLQAARLLTEGRRAIVIERQSGGYHRFIHERVREILLAHLDEAETASLHQKIAETMDSTHRETDDPELLGRLAYHYCRGVQSATPQRAFDVLVRAARHAMQTYDASDALRLLRFAATIVGQLREEPGAEFHHLFGEVELVAGSPERALHHLAQAVSHTKDALKLAHIWSRIAWLHQSLHDEANAWEALDTAFRNVGAPTPTESVDAVAGAIASWARARLLPRPSMVVAPAKRERLDLLCSLLFQLARFAAESGKVARLIQASLRALEPGEVLGPSAALSKSYLLYAYLLTGLKQHARGRRYVERAIEAAKSSNDPVAYAHALQIRVAISIAAGDFSDAIVTGKECIDKHGHWRELREYAYTCCTGLRLIESLRGRSRHAWEWVAKALVRANQHEGIPVLPAEVVLAAETAFVPLGRESETEELLAGLKRASRPVDEDSTFASWSFAVGVGRFTEKADLGPEFEALVEKFYAAKYDPEKVYFDALEFFVQVAHARVFMCLRASPSELPALLPKLERARRDIRAAARIPVIKAHSIAIDAYWAWYSGKPRQADRLFDRARAMAERHNCPWVVYAVARGRAHMLRANGRTDAALDQARIAIEVAKQHGSVYRVQWVREEFGLDGAVGTGLQHHNPTRAVLEPSLFEARKTSFSEPMREQLRSLLRMGQASGRDLDLVHQARSIICELVQSFGADRGFLYLRAPKSRRLELIAAEQSRGREALQPSPVGHKLVREVFETGEVRLVEAEASGWSVADAGGGAEPRSIVAVPLVVYDDIVGVVSLDSRLGRGAFTLADAEILKALAYQIPVAFELARSLRNRAEQQDALESEVAVRRRNELRYRKLIDSAYDAILILDERGCIVESNRRGCQLTRRTETQLRGTALTDLFGAASNEAVSRALQRAHRRGESFCGRALVAGEGGDIPVDLSASVLEIEGEPIVQIVLRDLREREQLEGKLREAQKMEVVGSLAKGIAHDFNNMITAIDVSTLAIRQNHDTNGEVAGLNNIQDASRRASEITRKLLTFSQQQATNITAMDLNQCLEEVLPIVRRLMGKGIRIECDLDPRMRVVQADQAQVEQLVVNLAINARDAMGAAGTLRIATAYGVVLPDGADTTADRDEAEERTYATLTISDSGEGMADDVRTRIFEPFFTTKGESGTGLGLAIVYGIVQTHRGRIEVESSVQEGATFRVFFPQSKALPQTHSLEALTRGSKAYTQPRK